MACHPIVKKVFYMYYAKHKISNLMIGAINNYKI